MITKIEIAGEASFPPGGVTISPARVNYLFGANGTGKTTISRAINSSTSDDSASDDSASDNGFKIEWDGGTPLEAFVYNKDFIENNFGSQMLGVFTLGAAEKKTLEDLHVKNEEKSEIKNNINTRSLTLSEKKSERDQKYERFKEDCWKQKVQFETNFKDALTGSIRSKEVFCNKILAENTNNKSQLQFLETLQQKAQTLFSGSTEQIPLMPMQDFSALQQALSNPIWQKSVIGSADIGIAQLIDKLENSDWVRQGRQYLEHSEEDCPFCQQNLPDDFKGQLERYFGEQFAKDTNLIKDLIDEHTNQCRQILHPLENLSENQKPFFEDGFEKAVQTLRQIFQQNHRLFEQKVAGPSQKIESKSIETACENVSKLIVAGNTKITDHNNQIENINSERKILTGEVWKYILEELKVSLEQYKKEIPDLKKAIDNLNTQIEDKNTELSKLEQEIADLEKKSVSVQPTVDTINKTLSSYGFTGFKLSVDEDEKNKYRLVRNGRKDEGIHKTLSEGEKSFITFLYFYYLIYGSASSSGTLSDRIVVFDDPVSSLDSSILFVVNSLVRKVTSDVLCSKGKIKQAFILTHNVFFHKQVSFRSDERHNFWVLRKIDGHTSVDEHGSKNPVKTAYGLLWDELKQETLSQTALPNALRRILEYYFKILGGYDFDSLLDKFEGEEKIIVESLIAWAHTSSHGLFEDEDHTLGDIDLKIQCGLFESIFEKTGNIAHYNMMMGKGLSIESDS